MTVAAKHLSTSSILLIVLGVIIFVPVLTLWLPDAILGR